MTQMTIRYDGRDWHYDDDVITMKQAVAIQLTYGWNLGQYEDAAKEGDSRALQCMWWLIQQQNGVTIPITETDADLVKLTVALSDAMEAARAAEAPPAAEPELPPTLPAGPPSPGSPIPPAMTLPPPRAVPEGVPVTAS